MMLRSPFPAGARLLHRCMMHGSQAGPRASLGLVPLTTKEEQLLWAERIRPHVPHCVTHAPVGPHCLPTPLSPCLPVASSTERCGWCSCGDLLVEHPKVGRQLIDGRQSSTYIWSQNLYDIYNNLMQHASGHVNHGTFYILNDSPASHAVVWEWKFAATSQYVSMFCLEREADQLVEALGAAPFLDWRSNLTLYYIPPYLRGLVQRLAEEKGAKLRLGSFVGFTYEPQLDTEPLSLGPGLRVCLLGRAGVHRLLQHVEYESDVLLEEMYSLAQRVPYLGVYRDAAVTQQTIVDATNLSYAADEDLPVAWVCSSFLGTIAKGFVEESYRRRGLGSLLSNTLARRQGSLLGFIPHGFVDTNNFASRMVFSELAGWKYTHDAFWLWPGITNKP